nr:U3 small nucleolar RNA-associated protein 25 isoform X1 [Tanacetum cinerariifolium]
MIVASPLGLITKIGEAEADKEKDVDYLSSIEVLLLACYHLSYKVKHAHTEVYAYWLLMEGVLVIAMQN